MSWRIQGKSVAFPKADTVTTGKLEIGKLVQLNTASKVVLSGGLTTFPLTEVFDVDGGDTVAAIQLDGIASVYITTAAGIDVGSPIALGSSNGGEAATNGDEIIGYALEKPAGNGVNIPVLLVKHVAGIY